MAPCRWVIGTTLTRYRDTSGNNFVAARGARTKCRKILAVPRLASAVARPQGLPQPMLWVTV
ncbi:unnamed protein product, partial [Nesidiocoris tenuis]